MDDARLIMPLTFGVEASQNGFSLFGCHTEALADGASRDPERYIDGIGMDLCASARCLNA